jgi:glycosyltransferase involved in cell wall biosynthesis
MFSIIIPLYNKAPYVLNSIDSILNQTFQKFELIIVDDGYTDDGLIKIKNRKAEICVNNPKLSGKIKLVEQANQGVSIARNKGVKIASYDYVAFLDADDWWDIGFLENMKSLIEDFPDAGVYGCRYFWVKNRKIKPSINHENEEFRGYIDYLKAYNFAWWMPLSSISVVIPKRIFIEFGGFKPNLKFAEDFDLWIRIALKYKVGYTNKPLAYYNQDVELSNRALGSEKIYPPESYSAFNWDYLTMEEKNNPGLKELLDGLRVRSLLRYYLSGKYPKETLNEIRKIDFSKQSAYYRRIYSYPRTIVFCFFKLKTIGSRIKQFLKNNLIPAT